MVMRVCDPSAQEAEAGESVQVGSHPGVHCECRASLMLAIYSKACLQKNENQNKEPKAQAPNHYSVSGHLAVF